MTKKTALFVYIIFIVSVCYITFPKQYKLHYSNSSIDAGNTAGTFFSVYSKGNYYSYSINDRITEIKAVASSKASLSHKNFELYYSNFKVGTFDVVPAGKKGEYKVSIAYNNFKIILIALGTLLIDTMIAIYLAKKLLPKFVDHKLNPGGFIRSINQACQNLIIILAYYLFYCLFRNSFSKPQFSDREFLFYIAALTVVVFSVSKIEKRRWVIYLLTVPISIILFISLYKIGSFLTVDEARSFSEQLYLQSDPLRHWEMASSRLNYVIMGTIWTLCKNGYFITLAVPKLFHWLAGIVIIARLTRFIACKICTDNKLSKSIVFMTFFTIITLCPSTLIAIKNYNYNLFSMLFGACAAVVALYSLEQSEEKYMWLALAFAALATMEKMIAYPVMLFCMIGLLWVSSKNQKRPLIRLILVNLKAHLFVILLSVGCTVYLQYFLRGDLFPRVTISGILVPLFDLPSQFAQKFFKPFLWGGVCLNIILVFLGFLVFFLLNLCVQKFRIIMKPIQIIETILFTLLLFFEAVYAYIVIYTKNLFIDNMITFSMICNSFIIAAFIFILVLRCLGKINFPVIYDFIFLFSILGIPYAYTYIMHLRGGIMYYNVWILIFTLGTVIVYYKYFIGTYKANLLTLERITLCAVMCIILEVLPFEPAYTIFIPFWARGINYDKKIELDTLAIGNHQPGWGEDILIAGEAIVEYLEKNELSYSPVNIYTSYHGEWLTNPGYPIHWMPGFTHLGPSITSYNIEDIPVAENDFYVFSRFGSTTSYHMEFSIPPKDYEPIIKIKQANMTKIWVYTGDQIKDFLYETHDRLLESAASSSK